MMNKTCIKCALSKNLDEFCYSKSFKDGRNSTCKECVNQRTKQWIKEKGNATYIYSISCPMTNNIVYIGKTTTYKISIRKSIHFGNTKNVKTPISKWIKSLSIQPIFEVLDIVPIDEVYFWEKFYIQLMKSWGYRLYNVNYNKK